jgi:hypothetical protein
VEKNIIGFGVETDGQMISALVQTGFDLFLELNSNNASSKLLNLQYTLNTDALDPRISPPGVNSRFAALENDIPTSHLQLYLSVLVHSKVNM